MTGTEIGTGTGIVIVIGTVTGAEGRIGVGGGSGTAGTADLPPFECCSHPRGQSRSAYLLLGEGMGRGVSLSQRALCPCVRVLVVPLVGCVAGCGRGGGWTTRVGVCLIAVQEACCVAVHRPLTCATLVPVACTPAWPWACRYHGYAPGPGAPARPYYDDPRADPRAADLAVRGRWGQYVLLLWRRGVGGY